MILCLITVLLTHAKTAERDVRVLEFHHVGGEDIAVGAMVSGGCSIRRIMAEIQKCKVLCANCHRRITVEDRGWFKKRR